MLKKFTRKKKSKDVKKLLEDVTERMDKLDPFSEDYEELLKYAERLHKLKNEDDKVKVTRNSAIWGVAGSLGGIVAIMGYERMHIITTKALGFVLKRRV
jgi:hypothetical protein